MHSGNTHAFQFESPGSNPNSDGEYVYDLY